MSDQPENDKIKVDLSGRSIDRNAPQINTTASKRISKSHEQELDRRLEQHKSGKTTFVAWADLKNELNNS